MSLPLPPPNRDDDDVCICFHVRRRQIIKFIRLEQPRMPSQCSECYGAGTGCGWCIPFIESLFEQVRAGVADPDVGMSMEEYRARRKEYHRTARVAPPDAQPGQATGIPRAGNLKDSLIEEEPKENNVTQGRKDAGKATNE